VAVEGAIADRVRGILPVTWDALIADRRYGDALLRNSIDTVKETVFGVVVLPQLEAAYPLIVIDYVAKLCAIELITPAIDYWMDEPYQISQSGSGNEVTTSSEKADRLRQLREDLLRQTRALEPIVGPLIGFRRTALKSRPRSSTIDDPFLTPALQEFPRPYKVTDRS
jgi:hypothetical protein